MKKEKLLEASLRMSVCQLGNERDDTFAAMKKSQLAHTLAVAKHENKQSELKQKLITVGLIREAWDDVRVAAGVDVVPAGTAGGDADGSSLSATASTASINGSAPDSRTGAGGDTAGSISSTVSTVVVIGWWTPVWRIIIKW